MGVWLERVYGGLVFVVWNYIRKFIVYLNDFMV